MAKTEEWLASSRPVRLTNWRAVGDRLERGGENPGPNDEILMTVWQAGPGEWQVAVSYIGERLPRGTMTEGRADTLEEAVALGNCWWSYRRECLKSYEER